MVTEFGADIGLLLLLGLLVVLLGELEVSQELRVHLKTKTN
jgi:hypothetical protein